MPSLKKKQQEEEDDPLKRRQKKAQAAAAAVATGAAAAPGEALKPGKKIQGDRLDYSRFKGIGEDDKEERMKTGDVVWDELSKDQKKEVWQAEEQMEALIDKKRQEEDEWRRQLRDKPADLSWVQGQHFASYEAFCVGRVQATLKKSGNEAFQKGDYDKARMDWEGGIQMLLALGEPPPEAISLICVLRNNLAQLHLNRGEWNKVKELTDKILDKEPTNNKALYRRAHAYWAYSIWDKAEKDLELCVKVHPGNKDAALLLTQVRRKLGKDKATFGGKACNDIAAGIQEITPDGTVRKLRIEEYGEGNPDEPADWVKQRWLESGTEKAVVTCQMIISSVGGEELYNSREYRPFPDTKQARDELKEYMDMVNFLDQEAKKAPRLVGDFYRKVKKRPVRWYLGDPGMYKGFDLAVRTMKSGEKALFEVDQPMLSPSVEKFYEKVGFHSGVAGLPQLIYTIEEERLSILEDEMTETDLDLENRRQRGVKVELQLLGVIPYRDVSPEGDGSKIHAVLHPGLPDAPVIRRGDLVRGSFFINRPFDGSLLVQNAYVEWRLGEDEGLFEKCGDQKEPLRPDGGAFVPRCVGQAVLDVDWVEGGLHFGALVEVRMRHGPELHEIAPMYKEQFEQARRENHKKGRKGGAACSVLVQILPPEEGRPEEDDEPGFGTTLVDESIPKDMEIE
uniref:Peptidylprolyl isomerase n=1 Tax=Alexandrium monilatum TaxID=311494 RepID=A0A7S4W9P5_9DINO